jgi:hypothetical protein
MKIGLLLAVACQTDETSPRPGGTSAGVDTGAPLLPDAWTTDPDIEVFERLFEGPTSFVVRSGTTHADFIDLLDPALESVYRPEEWVTATDFTMGGRWHGDDLIYVGLRILDDLQVTTRIDGLWSNFFLPGWAGHETQYNPGVVADLTGDAEEDLVFATYREEQHGVWLLHGPISAELLAPPVTAVHSAQPSGIEAGDPVVADLTGDGAPDLAASLAYSAHVVAGPIGPGTYITDDYPGVELQAVEQLDYWLPMGPATGADLDGDGMADLALSIRYAVPPEPGLSVAAWAGPIATERDRDDTLFRLEFPVGGALPEPVVWMQAADIDDDGQADLVLESDASGVRSPVTGNVWVAYGPLIGAIASATLPKVNARCPEGAILPEAAAYVMNLDDIDGDGDADLVMGMVEDGREPLLGDRTAVFLGPTVFPAP